jgi:ABC-2 type transport system ATP-binding protein
MSRKFLEIRNLTKTYFQKNKPVKEALRGVSLDLFEGEIFALLGVNGAGKTTLSSILASLHPPSTGEVLWKGTSIYEDIISYRQIIGFCPQKPNIDRTFNLRDNLIFSGLCYGMDPKKTETRVDDLIERFDLKGYVDADLKFLSGGYKQRFLLARALVHFPKLIILDEPTVGLDPHVRRHLWESIHSLKKEGSSILLTTHYLEEAEQLSDRVCIIHEGKIRLIDTPDNLKRDFRKEKLEDIFVQLMDEEKKIDETQ